MTKPAPHIIRVESPIIVDPMAYAEAEAEWIAAYTAKHGFPPLAGAANAMYDLGRQAFAEGSIAYLTDTIKLVFANIAGGHYAVNLATDQYLSAIASGDRVATSGAFASKTTTAGVLDAADVTVSAVTGAQFGAIVLLKDTGSAATSPLFGYIDTATGLPFTPSGGDVIVQWDNGANRILKL